MALIGSGYVILDIDKASPKLLNLYMEEKTQQYDEIPEVGKDIWIMFREDFEEWNTDFFKKAGTTICRTLRDTLVKKGVYITKDGQPIAARLDEVL